MALTYFQLMNLSSLPYVNINNLFIYILIALDEACCKVPPPRINLRPVSLSPLCEISSTSLEIYDSRHYEYLHPNYYY